MNLEIYHITNCGLPQDCKKKTHRKSQAHCRQDRK